MVMNVKPIPALDDRINDIRLRTAQIVNDDILPNEDVLWRAHANGEVTDRERRASSGVHGPILPQRRADSEGTTTARAVISGRHPAALDVASRFGPR